MKEANQPDIIFLKIRKNKDFQPFNDIFNKFFRLFHATRSMKKVIKYQCKIIK